MPDDARLVRLKGRVSARLLSLPGVSGVGISGGRLAVYLVQDEPSVRAEVERIVGEEETDVEVAFAVTGALRKQ